MESFFHLSGTVTQYKVPILIIKVITKLILTLILILNLKLILIIFSSTDSISTSSKLKGKCKWGNYCICMCSKLCYVKQNSFAQCTMLGTWNKLMRSVTGCALSWDKQNVYNCLIWCQNHTYQFHSKCPQSGVRKKWSKIKGIYASNIMFLFASSCNSAPCSSNFSCVEC